jgi:fatty acid/phospholipid biosynthesis enzyme
MLTLAVDAMGGDAGLAVTIPGALAFLKQQPTARLIMVGDEAQLQSALAAAHAPLERIRIQHATQVVDMDEAPPSALKNKKDSSMRVAINQVKEGAAQAAVSAGNTGALMATARFVLKTIPGIDRPAIAKFLPAQNDHLTLMLDLGANVDCTSEQLFQFALNGQRVGGRAVSSARCAQSGALKRGHRRHQRHRHGEANLCPIATKPIEFYRQCGRQRRVQRRMWTWWWPTASPAMWC